MFATVGAKGRQPQDVPWRHADYFGAENSQGLKDSETKFHLPSPTAWKEFRWRACSRKSAITTDNHVPLWTRSGGCGECGSLLKFPSIPHRFCVFQQAFVSQTFIRSYSHELIPISFEVPDPYPPLLSSGWHIFIIFPEYLWNLMSMDSLKIRN